MCKNFLLGLCLLILLFSIACSGPAVTSSDTSSLNDQPLSGTKKDIEKKVDETLAAGTVIRASLQHALSKENNVAGGSLKKKVVDEDNVDQKEANLTVRSINMQVVRT